MDLRAGDPEEGHGFVGRKLECALQRMWVRKGRGHPLLQGVGDVESEGDVDELRRPGEGREENSTQPASVEGGQDLRPLSGRQEA